MLRRSQTIPSSCTTTRTSTPRASCYQAQDGGGAHAGRQVQTDGIRTGEASP